MGQLISAQNKEFIQQLDVQKVEMDYLCQTLNVEHPELLDPERDAKRIEECRTELGHLKSKVADPETNSGIDSIDMVRKLRVAEETWKSTSN